MGRKLQAKFRPEEHELHTEAHARGREGTKTQNPMVIRSWRAYMQQVYETKVTRLTLGELWFCLVQARPKGFVTNHSSQPRS